MLLPIVNEHDEIIGMKKRDALVPGEDICRASALWLTNSKGEILISRRSMEKKYGPGLWGTAAGGAVEGDESYELNVIRETEEEIGLSFSPEELILGPKIRRRSLFLQWYFATRDVPLEKLSLQKEEVMDARWVTSEELSQWIDARPEEFMDSIIGLFQNISSKG